MKANQLNPMQTRLLLVHASSDQVSGIQAFLDRDELLLKGQAHSFQILLCHMRHMWSWQHEVPSTSFSRQPHISLYDMLVAVIYALVTSRLVHGNLMYALKAAQKRQLAQNSAARLLLGPSGSGHLTSVLA